MHLPAGGEILEIDQVRVRILVTAGQTRGAWSLVEYQAPPFFPGPARHRHHKTQETFYILAGTLTFTVAGEPWLAPPGSCLVVPPQVPHVFANLEPVPCTFLIWFTPGGMEAFYRELLQLRRHAPAPPEAEHTAEAELRLRYDIFPE